MGAAPACPVCQARQTKRHCKSHTCAWKVCPTCGLTFDPAGRRGIDANNKPVELR